MHAHYFECTSLSINLILSCIQNTVKISIFPHSLVHDEASINSGNNSCSLFFCISSCWWWHIEFFRLHRCIMNIMWLSGHFICFNKSLSRYGLCIPFLRGWWYIYNNRFIELFNYFFWFFWLNVELFIWIGPLFIIWIIYWRSSVRLICRWRITLFASPCAILTTTWASFSLLWTWSWCCLMMANSIFYNF